jgi:predicted PurR-regulated permease PerM
MESESSGPLFSVKTLATSILIVALLYWAKEVFVPFVLAILFSFLLGPMVTRLRRWGCGRVLAVSTVTVLAFASLFSLGWVATRQLLHFAHELPYYQRNIQTKVQSILQSVYGPLASELDKTSRAIEELQDQAMNADQRLRRGTPSPERVEIVPPAPSLSQLIRRSVGPLFRPLGTGLMVTVMVICILLNREDLRNRVIRLFGRHRLPLATRALDDAARGVSRFLMMQSLINGGYGLLFGLGLFLIGLPNGLLWGAAAAVLRFIPYVGSWIAGLTAIIFALAVFDGWSQTLLVAGLFVLLEIVSNYLVEPWLYGTRTGLSPLAVLLAATFWGWLWGPVGLLLSTPLTVCVLVISRHFPQLGFFSILLGDEPVLGPKSRLYQRLLALDKGEATELIAQQLAVKPLVEVCDETIVPILRLASADRRLGVLEAKRAAFLFACLQDEIARLSVDALSALTMGHNRSDPARVYCVPAQDEADQLSALLFVRLLHKERIPARQTSMKDFTAEIACQEKHNRAILCVSAITLPALENTRRLIKPLRTSYPNLQILAGLWDAVPQTPGTDFRELEAAGANQVVTTLQAGLDVVSTWCQAPRFQHDVTEVRIS